MHLKKIKLTEIKTTENSRPDNFDCSELMESIKESGLIQPIVVAKNFYSKTGKPYVLVAGNRRYKAVKKLGFKIVDAVVNTSIKNEADLLIFNMSENLQRKDVTAFEQGRLIDILVRRHKLTEKECAVRLGVTQAKVSAMVVAYKELPAKYSKKITMKTGQTKGMISLSVAKDIAKMKKAGSLSTAGAKELLQGVLDGKYTSRHVSDIKSELGEGSTFAQVKNGVKKVAYISMRVPVYINERDEVDGRVNDYLEQLVYGETRDHFTRPRFN